MLYLKRRRRRTKCTRGKIGMHQRVRNGKHNMPQWPWQSSRLVVPSILSHKTANQGTIPELPGLVPSLLEYIALPIPCIHVVSGFDDSRIHIISHPELKVISEKVQKQNYIRRGYVRVEFFRYCSTKSNKLRTCPTCMSLSINKYRSTLLLYV